MEEDRITEYLERGVSALERLAQDPVIEMETAPPLCPHCERVSPTVRVHESDATGPMAEIVYQFHCTHCNSVFYGVPVHWFMAKTTEEAAQLLNERAEISGYNG